MRTSRASLRVKRCVDAAHAREAARKARKSLGTRGCFRAGACDAKFALASKTGRRGRLVSPLPPSRTRRSREAAMGRESGKKSGPSRLPGSREKLTIAIFALLIELTSDRRASALRHSLTRTSWSPAPSGAKPERLERFEGKLTRRSIARRGSREKEQPLGARSRETREELFSRARAR